MKRNLTAAALTLLLSGASAVLAQAEITAEQIGRLDAIVTPPQLSERTPGVHTVPCLPGVPAARVVAMSRDRRSRAYNRGGWQDFLRRWRSKSAIISYI